MTMQENCPKDGGNSVLSAPKEKMDKNAEYSRTATSPQISSQFATRFAGNVVVGPFHVLKFQNKLYSVTLVCCYLIHVLTWTKWDLELWTIYKAPFLWLCTVSLSLFCTVRGGILRCPCSKITMYLCHCHGLHCNVCCNSKGLQSCESCTPFDIWDIAVFVPLMKFE